MLYRFKKHIEEKFSDIIDKKVLVAISGGVDSIVLAFLLKKIEIPIVLAHCNFQLRGNESDEDQLFVESFAQKNKLPLKTIRFETKKEAQLLGKNTQLTARELRYDWFKKIAQESHCEYIATGHQADDSLETFLINLSRGTGLTGLTGIPERNELIIRPLLPFSRKEIIDFATENKLSWREDSSNASDAYTRNKIRHHISEHLKQIHPEFLFNFRKTQHFLQQTQLFISDEINKFRQKYFIQKENQIYFKIDEIRQNPNRKFIIFELMKPFGFSNVLDLEKLFFASSGKQLFSSTHRIITNRNEWIIDEIITENQLEIYEIPENTTEIISPIHLLFSFEKIISSTDKNNIFVDANLVEFPLKLRKRKESDVFYPFGMNFKKKKLSKFFKDEKYSLLQKENQWILVDNLDRIIWVVGIRADERFKIQKECNNILRIKLL